MSKFTEVVVVGVFPPAVQEALSRPLNGSRFRLLAEANPPFVSDILVCAFKNINPQTVLDHIQSAIGDYNAVVVIDDDVANKIRTIRFIHGVIDSDSGDE